jgi:hypothetical protein
MERVNIKRFIRFFVIVLVAGTGTLSCYEGGRADPLTLKADLAFNLICRGKDRSMLEDELEGFLKNNGFKVLNLARIQHEHQIFLLDTRIISLDENRRRVDLHSVPLTENTYSLGLKTPPPTQRVPQLENAVLKFVSDTLGCEVRDIERGQNDADALPFYEMQVKRIEDLFLQAGRLRGDRRL